MYDPDYPIYNLDRYSSVEKKVKRTSAAIIWKRKYKTIYIICKWARAKIEVVRPRLENQQQYYRQDGNYYEQSEQEKTTYITYI
jgi:hypothetical protein